MPGIIDGLIVLVFGLVAYLVASEGIWTAVMMTIVVILSGLVAFNFFEPAAELLQNNGLAGYAFQLDFVMLVGIFAACVGLLRLALFQLSPDEVETPEAFGEMGRWAVGGLCGWITTCFLLAALHTAPMPREFIGFAPERKNLLNVIAPDRQWLGFVQYCSNAGFGRRQTVVIGSETRIVTRTFDGPYIAVAGSEQEQWPSFPIRYATRREAYAGGGGSGGGGGAYVPSQPAGGGGGGGEGGGGNPAPPPTGPTVPDF